MQASRGGASGPQSREGWIRDLACRQFPVKKLWAWNVEFPTTWNVSIVNTIGNNEVVEGL